MSSPALVIDGEVSGPILIAPTKITYPFVNYPTKDSSTKVYERAYVQDRASYAPAAAFSTLPNDGPDDPADATAYLVYESDPVPDSSNDGTLQFVRRWANIPADKFPVPPTRSITKPTIANQTSWTVSIRSPQSQATETATAIKNSVGFWATDNSVYSPIKSNFGNIFQVYATSGSFTLTYKTDSATFACNASISSICTALNAFPSVVADGLYFSDTLSSNSLTSSSSGYLSLSTNPVALPVSLVMNASGLGFSVNGAPASAAVASAALANIVISGGAGQTNQVWQLPMVASMSGHGLSSGVSLLIVYDSTSTMPVRPALLYGSSQWGVVDANTIWLCGRYTPAPTSNPMYVAPYLRTYIPGAATLPTRVTEKYYLPGAPGQPATEADIPTISPNISDGDIINAVLTKTGYQPVAFQGPEVFSGALQRTITTEINFDSI